MRSEVVDSQETGAIFKAKRITENIQKRKDEPLYRQFLRQGISKIHSGSWYKPEGGNVDLV